MRLVDKLGRLAGAVGRSIGAYPAARQEARHQLVSIVATRLGLRLQHHGLVWPSDGDVGAAWRSFPGSDGRFGDKRFNLFNLARAARSVRGNSAECGVFRGAGSHMILSALSLPERSHHVFDSFEGLSAPDERDRGQRTPSYVWKKNDLSAPEATVRKNLSQFQNVQLHKGWIPSRFGDVAGEEFNFVHIDVDLYQPTFDSIAFFYPRMVPGGIVVCDDYGFESCPGARAAINDFMRSKPEAVVHLTTGQAFVIKGPT